LHWTLFRTAGILPAILGFFILYRRHLAGALSGRQRSASRKPTPKKIKTRRLEAGVTK